MSNGKLLKLWFPILGALFVGLWAVARFLHGDLAVCLIAGLFVLIYRETKDVTSVLPRSLKVVVWVVVAALLVATYLLAR